MADSKRTEEARLHPSASALAGDASRAVAPADELPVVARLVIEIRSDGTRTVARGALEDRLGGETISLHTEGSTPAALALSLRRSLQRLPLFGAANAARAAARSVLQALLPGKKK